MADAKELPGPGSYTTRKKFSINDSPAYKIGEKLKEKIGKLSIEEIFSFKYYYIRLETINFSNVIIWTEMVFKLT